MSKNPLKKKIAICNLIISVLCVLSIVAYFFMPFWKVELSLTLNTETFESVMGDMMPENSNSDENSDDENSDEEGMSFTDGNQIVMLSSDSDEELSSEEEMMKEMIEDIVGEEGVTLSISLELKTADLLGSLTGDSTEAVETMLGNVIENLVDTIYEPVTEILSKTAKVVAKQAVKTTVRESIKEAFTSDEKTEEEVNEILTEAGITDEYIDSSLDDLMTKLENGVSVEEVSEDVVAMVKDAMSKLEDISDEYPEFEGMELSEEDEEEFRAEFEDMLTEMLANEEGEINLDEALADMLLQMMNESENGGEGEYDEGSVAIAPVKVTYTASSSADESGDTQGNSVEQLKTKIRDMIMEELGADEETVEMISMIMQILSYVILFTFFTWFYLILKILVKLGAKNNAIKLKVPILFGWLPCLVLVLIPSIAFSTLTNPDTLMSMGMGAAEVEEIVGMMGMINVKFVSASIVSFVVAIVLFLFVIFYYGRLRRKLRKQIKAAKKAAKLGYATGDDSSSSSDSSSDDNNDYDY